MNIDEINEHENKNEAQSEQPEENISVDPVEKATTHQNTVPPIVPEDHSADSSPVVPPPLNNDRAGSPWQQNHLDTSPVQDALDKIKKELAKVIVGQDEMIELMLAAIFTNGHVLIEGVPGIAKTLTAKLMAQTLKTEFNRIQFTPDLMPTDVVGTTVYNLQTSEFSFNRGPVFSNIILIDEINRAPAKTQSALFEVMEEYQVTMDGETYYMEFPFFVIATQNPIEQEGTYKLPEAQLDRFLFKINVDYPNLEEEKQILRNFKNDFKMVIREEVTPVFSPEELKNCQNLIEKVYIREELIDYIAAIIHNTRNNGDLFLGASPRASLAILKTAKAIAAMNGRDFVTPDDIQYVAFPVLNHRIILTPEREMEGYAARDVIDDIIKKIEVPR
jgi:MoxR-like ATPase